MLVCSASLAMPRLATALHPPRRPPRGTPRPVTRSSQAGAGALAPPSPTSCALLISSFRNDEAACSQAGGDDPRKGRDRGATPITAPPLGPPTPERRAPLGGTTPRPEPRIRPSASICGIRLDRARRSSRRRGPCAAWRRAGGPSFRCRVWIAGPARGPGGGPPSFLPGLCPGAVRVASPAPAPPRTASAHRGGRPSGAPGEVGAWREGAALCVPCVDTHGCPEQ